MTHDEREDCPAEHLSFTPTVMVTPGYSRTPGVLDLRMDLRMDCADCGTWAIVRYHPGYPFDGLHEKLANLAPGKHTAPFEAYVRSIRAREEMRTT